MSLGMTGPMVVRGDAQIAKALSKPDKQVIGFAAGALGVGALASTPPAMDMRRRAKVSSLLYRSGNPEYRALDRSQKKAYVRRLVDGPVNKRDHDGAMVGAGTTLGTVGLVGGGVPGLKAKGLLADARNASGRRAQAAGLARAYRGGEFGYRHNAHHTFKTFGLGGDLPKNATKGDAFSHGDQIGRVAAEDTIIRHLKIGRRASNVALLGGGALAATGAVRHHQRARVGKAARRGDFAADSVAAGGATTAGMAAGISHVLDREGRKWSTRAAENYSQAHAMNPKMGTHEVRENKTRVPDAHPKLRGKTIAADADKIFAGQTRGHAEGAGRLRGTASQARYFAHTYGGAARIARKVGVGGALVGATALGAKHLEVRKNLAMPKGIRIPSTSAITDLRGQVQFLSQLPKIQPGNPQRVLHTVRRPKRKLTRVRELELSKAAQPSGVVRTLAATGRKRTLSAERWDEMMRGYRRRTAPKVFGKVLRVKVVDAPFTPRAKRKPKLNSGYAALGGGYISTTAGDVGAAYSRRGFVTSAGTPRTLRRGEFTSAVSEVRRQRGPTMHERMRERLGNRVTKVDTTMSERRAHDLARQYDTRGPLPKGLSRPQKMKAYEARYIASGGKKAEKWQRRATASEAMRNVGLAGATGAAGLLLASRGKRTGPVMQRAKITRHLSERHLEQAGLASGLTGGASELYGEHARARRASYTNSAAGVAASALTRMRGYTPDRRS